MRKERIRTMPVPRLACCGIVASLLLTADRVLPVHGHPQTIQQPTFRSGTALVEVDAVVLDRDGNFVPGLRADDLRIFEDGKEQKIRQFYMVTYNSVSGVPTRYDDQADYRAHRVFVLLFDEGHLAVESILRAKRGAEEFIRDQMSRGDVGGVFVAGGMFKGRLTTDKAELIAAVRTVSPVVDNRQALLAPFREFPRIPSETDAMRIADGAREVVHELGVMACETEPQECAMPGGLQQIENAIQNKSRLYIRQARILMDTTVRNLQTIARGLSRIPGRKTVVLITEGFFVEESRSILQQVAGELARASITIYSLDSRGLVNSLSPNPDVARRERARSTAFDTGEDAPNILTSGTGGLMVRNIDDMSRAFGLIVRDTSTYYVIGYQPENSTMDGKFRKIEVTSKAGLRVRARKGYAATTLPPQQGLWGTRK
jgi:VWFA-related protein